MRGKERAGQGGRDGECPSKNKDAQAHAHHQCLVSGKALASGKNLTLTKCLLCATSSHFFPLILPFEVGTVVHFQNEETKVQRAEGLAQGHTTGMGQVREPGWEARVLCCMLQGGTPIPPKTCLGSGRTPGDARTPTFIIRKKVRVPKMVNCGWYHSSHRFWGSGSVGQGGDEFRVISAHELLSNSDSRCSSMDSWSRSRWEFCTGAGGGGCSPYHSSLPDPASYPPLPLPISVGETLGLALSLPDRCKGLSFQVSWGLSETTGRKWEMNRGVPHSRCPAQSLLPEKP